MGEFQELTTEVERLYLTNVPQPTRLPLIRDRGRWRLRTPGHWVSPWLLLALALGVGAGWWLLRLLGRVR